MLRPKHPSINDVARLAGVSKKTVSRIINNEPNVSEKMRRKVQSAIDECSYTPNSQARGLSLSRSFLVSVVYDNPNASYVMEAMYGALDYCRSQGYELIMHPCDFSSPTAIDDLMTFIGQSKIDGVILLQPISESAELASTLKEAGCNFVRLLSTRCEDEANMIYHNDGIAVNQIVAHLAERGHRQIAHIRGPLNSQSANQRHAEFLLAMEKQSLVVAEHHVVLGDYTFRSGIDSAESLLASNSPPSAIFASNDEMAIGAIVAAQRMGIKIPTGLAVVGFDDSPHASRMWPALTTVNLRVKEMTQLAAQKLIAQCNGNNSAAADVPCEVKPIFIQRQTTDIPSTTPK